MVGTAPNRIFIVQFTNVPTFEIWGVPGYATFQFKLFETTNVIEVHYLNMVSNGYYLYSAGIENQTGTVGVLHYQGTPALPNNSAVRYTPPTGIPNDEDGVVLSALVPGQPATATVTVANGPGRPDFWIDFNGNGVFEPTERVSPPAGTLVTNGANLIPFTVPGGAVLGPTYARFRISTAGGLGPTGLAPDGEVEDYAVTINLINPGGEGTFGQGVKGQEGSFGFGARKRAPMGGAPIARKRPVLFGPIPQSPNHFLVYNVSHQAEKPSTGSNQFLKIPTGFGEWFFWFTVIIGGVYMIVKYLIPYSISS